MCETDQANAKVSWACPWRRIRPSCAVIPARLCAVRGEAAQQRCAWGGPGDRYQAFAGGLEGEKVAGLGVMAKTLSKLLAPRADLAAPLLLPSQHPRDGGTDRFGRERIEVVGQLAGYFAKHRDVGTQHGRVGSQRLNDRHAKTFGEARHDQAVCFGDQRRLLMLVDITGEADVRRQVAHPASAAGVADYDQVG